MLLLKKIFIFIVFAIPLYFPGAVKAADGLDFPLGKPEAAGYSVTGLNYLDRYDYQGDGILEYHPGEDWNEARNGRDYGGDNNDYGDPVYSISDGVILYAKLHSSGWGNLVLIEHKIGGTVFWSQYAHMQSLSEGVSAGKSIKRGDIIGHVGSFPYGTKSNIHLHFEIRKARREAFDFVYNWSSDQVKNYYYRPTDFIGANRPVASQNITGVVDKNQSNLSWDKNTSTNFDHYEIYRSNVSGGTENPATRTTVATINDQNVTTFSDQNLPVGNYYYKVATFYKNGMMAYSNEFSLEIKREITKITMTNADQRQPFIYEGKIYWQDTPNGGTNSTGGLYSYDMKLGKVEVKNISNCGVKFPYSPTGNDGKIVFYGNTGNTYGTEVCYYNLATNTFLPISLSPLPKEQWYPTITDSGLIIWEDNRPGNFDLYFLDPAKSNGPEVFVSAFGQQINPRTWGNKVIWKDNRSNGNYDIFMKDLSGGSETKVAENAGDDFPDIWDKYIVWDFRGKLYLKNYETGETKTLHETGVGYNPRVRDGKVAYTLVEGNTSYIHIYDIATGKDLKIDFPLNFQSNLFVSQAYLAFDSADKATPWDFDIYLTQL